MGQHKKGDKKVGFWFTEAEHEILRQAAEKAGMDKTAYIKKLIREIAKEEGIINK